MRKWSIGMIETGHYSTVVAGKTNVSVQCVICTSLIPQDVSMYKSCRSLATNSVVGYDPSGDETVGSIAYAWVNLQNRYHTHQI